jgi:hypothetical protein
MSGVPEIFPVVSLKYCATEVPCTMLRLASGATCTERSVTVCTAWNGSRASWLPISSGSMTSPWGAIT